MYAVAIKGIYTWNRLVISGNGRLVVNRFRNAARAARKEHNKQNDILKISLSHYSFV